MHSLLLCKTKPAQVQLAHRLGYANVFDSVRPALHYRLRMWRQDEYQVRRHLVPHVAVSLIPNMACVHACMTYMVLQDSSEQWTASGPSHHLSPPPRPGPLHSMICCVLSRITFTPDCVAASQNGARRQPRGLHRLFY